MRGRGGNEHLQPLEPLEPRLLLSYEPDLGVSASVDGNPDANTFGRYIAGIDAPNFQFSASVTGTRASATDRVIFWIDGTPHEDDTPGDGWRVDYDITQLDHTATIDGAVFDDDANTDGDSLPDGAQSTAWTGTIDAIPLPAWLNDSRDLADISASFDPGSSTYGFDGTFTFIDYGYTTPDLPLDQLANQYSGVQAGVGFDFTSISRSRRPATAWRCRHRTSPRPAS